ncbi:MAG: beta-1,6-N-acetylglucosaminyltransferase [Flavobacteriaceae bacterium]|jgi:hypothetical protein|nr:beta-1,6-N-acetylglucosaminyltransferase [Flavobacteriaceae bacterium]
MAQKKKIAIMIIVHKNNEQIDRLVKHLSKDFDIYIHIDKRSSLKIRETEGVFVYRKYNVYWGSFNQIIATLFLLKKAFKTGYNRYILISGQDLPIKTNEEIKIFFENNDEEYIHIDKIPRPDGWPDMGRLTRYYFSRLNGRTGWKKLLRKLAEIVSKLIEKIKPRKLDYDFYGGSSWTNYTHNCVKKMFDFLENNPNYINRFKWTHCSDEIFYQTIVNQLDGLKITNDSLRYISWADSGASPKILKEEDYEEIIRSEALFARKFDENTDAKIIEMIYKYLENRR